MASVVAQKFALTCGRLESELLSQNHTSNTLILVSLLNPKFVTVRATLCVLTSDSGR
jgi:hypothetical protein